MCLALRYRERREGREGRWKERRGERSKIGSPSSSSVKDQSMTKQFKTRDIQDIELQSKQSVSVDENDTYLFCFETFMSLMSVWHCLQPTQSICSHIIFIKVHLYCVEQARLPYQAWSGGDGLLAWFLCFPRKR